MEETYDNRLYFCENKISDIHETISKKIYERISLVPNLANKKYIMNIDKMDSLNEITKSQPESPVTVCDVEKIYQPCPRFNSELEDSYTEKNEVSDGVNTTFYEKHDCIHNVIHDYIDITPDRSMQIRYCDKCMMTFS